MVDEVILSRWSSLFSCTTWFYCWTTSAPSGRHTV